MSVDGHASTHSLDSGAWLDRARRMLQRLIARPSVGRDADPETPEQVAALLDGLRPDGVLVLHRRELPDGTGGLIDHAVVGPAGAFTIAVERFDDSVEVRQGSLYVDGVDRAELVRRRRHQADSLERLLMSTVADARVTPVICFLGMDHQLRWEAETSRIVPADRLETVITAGGHLGPHEQVELAAALPAHLRAV